jgi:hypothetical protein
MPGTTEHSRSLALRLRLQRELIFEPSRQTSSLLARARCSSLSVDVLVQPLQARMNHFVEVIRQPVFVLGQVTEAFNRLLEFPDFARGVGIFD